MYTSIIHQQVHLPPSLLCMDIYIIECLSLSLSICMQLQDKKHSQDSIFGLELNKTLTCTLEMLSKKVRCPTHTHSRHRASNIRMYLFQKINKTNAFAIELIPHLRNLLSEDFGHQAVQKNDHANDDITVTADTSFQRASNALEASTKIFEYIYMII